jgi:translation elongation factor P/translation initiation factor 5A
MKINSGFEAGSKVADAFVVDNTLYFVNNDKATLAVIQDMSPYEMLALAKQLLAAASEQLKDFWKPNGN